jgi:hypothetical protein
MRACRFAPDRQPSTHSQQTSLVLPMRPQRQHFLLRLGGEAPDLPSASTVSRRFDGLLRACELVGFTPRSWRRRFSPLAAGPPVSGSGDNPRREVRRWGFLFR